MEAIVAAIIGEIASRSVTFLIDRCYQVMTKSITLDQRLHNLQRLLQRVSIIVQEAEGRDITNLAMIHKLNILRKEMYKGYFIVDNFRSQAIEAQKSKDHDVSRPFAVSNFNPAKRIFLSIGIRHDDEKELQHVLDSLSNIIVDASEFIVLLKNYSPIYRQPYSMHMLLSRCMFGRQMGMERIMNFLMIEEAHGTEHAVDVLPIFGPAGSGKSTLVAHVCNDERVRNNFTRILFVTEYDLENKGPNSFKDGELVVHQKNSVSGDERALVVIEFSDDVDEAAWKNYLASASCLTSSVKIIITSQSSEIKKFGTTEALRLNFLPPDAHWYFFKVLTFGSADPNDHPKLEPIAMDISRNISGSFWSANISAGILREHLNVKCWHMLRSNFTLNAVNDATTEKKHKYVGKRLATDDYFGVYTHDKRFTEDTASETTLHDIIHGSAKYEGRFQIVAWKSLMPRYKNYLCTCEILKTRQNSKKRNMIPH